MHECHAESPCQEIRLIEINPTIAIKIGEEYLPNKLPRRRKDSNTYRTTIRVESGTSPNVSSHCDWGDIQEVSKTVKRCHGYQGRTWTPTSSSAGAMEAKLKALLNSSDQANTEPLADIRATLDTLSVNQTRTAERMSGIMEQRSSDSGKTSNTFWNPKVQVQVPKTLRWGKPNPKIPWVNSKSTWRPKMDTDY